MWWRHGERGTHTAAGEWLKSAPFIQCNTSDPELDIDLVEIFWIKLRQKYIKLCIKAPFHSNK